MKNSNKARKNKRKNNKRTSNTRRNNNRALRAPLVLSHQYIDLYGEIEYSRQDSHYKFNGNPVLNLKAKLTNSPEFSLLLVYTSLIKVDRIDILMTKLNTVSELYPTAKMALYNVNNPIDEDQIRINNFPLIDFNNNRSFRKVIHINQTTLLKNEEKGYISPVGLPELIIKISPVSTGLHTDRTVANYHIRVKINYYKMDNMLSLNLKELGTVVKAREDRERICQDGGIDWYAQDEEEEEEIGKAEPQEKSGKEGTQGKINKLIEIVKRFKEENEKLRLQIKENKELEKTQ